MITLAEEAAKRGGAALMERFGRASLEVHKKAESDYVTEADVRSEEAIREFLAGETPDHGFLLEEGGASENPGAYRWIVDPLDGTTNYIHRYPFFSVSIALARGDEILLGVVYDPIRREMFTAEQGEPTRLNGVPVSVSRCPNLAEALLCTGFPFRSKAWIETYLESFRQLFLRSSGIRRDGSAALDLAYVAAGRFDTFWELGLKPWDVAAGAILVERAGGRVSDFGGGGDAIFGGDVIASNGRIHDEVVAIVRGAFAGGRPRGA